MLGETFQFREFVPLAPFTTFQIGGPARYFATARSEQELVEAVGFARERGLPLLLLGGGSNLLIQDGGFPGLVVHACLEGPIEMSRVDGMVELRVPAGTPWEAVVDAACDQGLSGMECLAGIPGLTGGTPVQNVGAYGQEVAGTIHSVRALDLRSTTMLDLSREACQFGYRSSIFNTTERGRYVVTDVRFRMDAAARPRLTYADLVQRFGDSVPAPSEVARVVREIRRGKGMLLVEGDRDCRSAGSFFKNPVVTESVLGRVAGVLGLTPEAVPHWPAGNGVLKLPAAWLLEQAGFHKGYVLGRAGISSRHSLALINLGGASCGDVIALREQIRRGVQNRFGIWLEQEPVEVGTPA